MEVVITGSSGLIGSQLVPALVEAGHRPISMVRRPPTAGADEIRWDPQAGEIDADSLAGVDAVVHLAGAGIGDRRWNDAYKQLLVTSRTEPTRLLATTLAGLDRPPSAFLSGSAIGFYGDRGDETLTEDSTAGTGFLPDLVQRWEAATAPADEAGIRTAHLRTGLVLTTAGGALAKMLPLFKLGFGGRFGSGRQYQSWISMSDEIGAVVHLLTATTSGPVNLTAPEPVTNREFTTALASAVGRPAILPVPAFGPKLLLGGEMAQSLLFDSQRIVPKGLTASGYRFAEPEIDGALRSVVGDDEAAG